MDFDTLKKSLSYGNVCSSGQYVMRETGSDATLKEVTIRDIPENSLVIKMDKINFTNLFNSNVIKSWGYCFTAFFTNSLCFSKRSRK